MKRDGRVNGTDRAHSDLPVCVMGAGISGLCTARRLLELGLRVEVLERRSGAGGLWNRDERYGGVYRSAHLISSRRCTELADYPMPVGYPDFPGHAQVLDYLRGFAAHYGIERHVKYGKAVRRAEPLDTGGWRVNLENGDSAEYSALVLATGHHWAPAVPDVVVNAFDGITMHSADYNSSAILAGKRVVIVGFGNSAGDVAVDAVSAGATVSLSVRSGNQVLPKYLFGLPIDRVNCDKLIGRLSSRLLPWRLKRALDERLIRALTCAPERFGLPRPQHRLNERQPLISSLLLCHIGHGDIRIRPPIAGLSGSAVRYVDGAEDEADIVIWCTGYQVSLPMIDVAAHLNGDAKGRPRLWLNLLPPKRDDIAVVGMVDTLNSWAGLDLQAQLVARHLREPGVLRNVPERRRIPDHPPGPDRNWLFQGRGYEAVLRRQLKRFNSH